MDQWSEHFAPQLAALDTLAEHDGHMTRAAEALGIPQSSMSRRIRALEKSLGIPLLIQDGRLVRLTPAAAELARQLRGPLRQVDSTIEAIASDADPERGIVRFGFPLTMGSGPVPDLLAEFRRRHQGIRVVLKQAHGAELASDLVAGRLDLAITIPAPDRLPHRLIGTQRIFAVLPETCALASRSAIAIEELAGETFIANPVTYNLRILTESWCNTAGFTPRISMEVTEFATIRELICRGLGIGLLPHDEHTPQGAVEVPLSGAAYERPIALSWGAAVEAPATRRLSSFVIERWTEPT
ncbi:LysR family transcriptional regulator [Nocardia sp. CA-290969]|uniref:LysR family transcriptional regulator n=1 Tax=Nocardia sp. CA-290969 TaxID=3239986 RepID=UPI003D8E2F24